MIEVVSAYALFIVYAALPVLVPAAMLILLFFGGTLILRGSGMPPASTLAMAILAFIGAGFLAAIMFGSPGSVPGAGHYQQARESVRPQQRAQRGIAPGGEFDRLMESAHGKRTCRWERTTGGWTKKCASEGDADARARPRDR